MEDGALVKGMVVVIDDQLNRIFKNDQTLDKDEQDYINPNIDIDSITHGIVGGPFEDVDSDEGQCHAVTFYRYGTELWTCPGG